jgi:sporulation protein YlmC with PRC-barrel domain
MVRIGPTGAGFAITVSITRKLAMAEIMLVIGSEARTTDNKVSGEVKSVVVERRTRTVTHLVVEPKGREGLARLVPLDHVDVPAGKIRLRYTEAEFKDLIAAEETLAEIFNAGPLELVTEGWRPADDEPVVDGGQISPVRAEVLTGERDLVPVLLPAEDEERRGDHVRDADDGEIGQLRALCIDPRTHQMTHVHVLLKEGHLRRHKEVAIPSGNVSGFTGGIHLNISRAQVQEMAQGDIDHSTE